MIRVAILLFRYPSRGPLCAAQTASRRSLHGQGFIFRFDIHYPSQLGAAYCPRQWDCVNHINIGPHEGDLRVRL